MHSIRCKNCVKPRKTWEKNPERISKFKSFIDKYNWEGINYPSKKDD